MSKGESRPHYIWRTMKARCLNPNSNGWENYGGRGITVCKRWLEFNHFWKDMEVGYKDDLQIERIDNNKGYYKENCRWATRKEQGRNKRNNRYIKVKSEKLIVSEAAEITLISEPTIRWRIHNGWPEDKLLARPRTYKRYTEKSCLIETPNGTMSASEAERFYGISEATLRHRKKKGWLPHQIIQKPRRKLDAPS